MSSPTRESRPVEPNTTGNELTISRRVRFVAWCQLLVALVLFLQAVSMFSSLDLLWLSIGIFLVGINATAGMQTLRKRQSGYWLSLWNHVAQIPAVGLGGYTFHYVGYGDAIVFVAFTVLPERDIFTAFGIDVEVIPRMLFDWVPGSVPPNFFGVGIDLIAIVFVTFLLSVLPRDKSTGFVTALLRVFVRKW